MRDRSPWFAGLAFGALVLGCAPSVAPSTTAPSPSAPSDSAPSASAPVGTPVAGEPASASAEFDGVIYTISVSSDRIAPGDEIQVRVEALNLGLEPVLWMSGGCGILNDLAITGPDLAIEPPGQPGSDSASLAKWSALSQGLGLAQWRPPDLPDGVAVGCPANLAYDDIDPGATEAADVIWRAADGFGAPAPAGEYTIAGNFAYHGRMAADELQGEPPPVRRIATSLPVLVEGPSFEGMPAPEAIDAATADPRVAAWFEGLPREQLSGAGIRLVDGVWEYAIDVGFDGATSVVRVDPETGDVLDVRLAGG